MICCTYPTHSQFSNANISVSSFTGKQNIKIIAHITGKSTGAGTISITFNSDTGANYEYTQSTNGGVAAGASGGTGMLLDSAETQVDYFIEINVINRSATRKVMNWRLTRGELTASTPTIIEGGGVWRNTAAQITTITLSAGGTTTMGAGSYVTVYGGST